MTWRSLKVPSTKNEHQTHCTANIMEGITVIVIVGWEYQSNSSRVQGGKMKRMLVVFFHTRPIVIHVLFWKISTKLLIVSDNASPECNLTVNCAYYMGEIAMSIRKVHLCTISLTYCSLVVGFFSPFMFFWMACYNWNFKAKTRFPD